MMTDAFEAGRRMTISGAVLTAIGIPLSGPVSLAIVGMVAPQPAWAGADEFVRHYHAIQTLPFFTGFALIFGYVLLIAGIHRMAEPARRGATTVALVFTSAFAALVFFNYICQTTFVPALVTTYRGEDAATLAAFSMANPRSLAWGLEMWGYALLGVATWLVAPLFKANRLERMTGGLMIANGVMSIGGGFATAFAPGWVLTAGGMVAYLLWNALVFALSLCLIGVVRRRARE